MIYDDLFGGCVNLTSIRYSGTKVQWGSIIKSYSWGRDSSIQTVECIDGTITL